MQQRSPITRKPFSGAVLFNSADEMLSAMFGPDQHDAHVSARRFHQKEVESIERAARFDEAMRDFIRSSEPARRRLDEEVSAWRRRFT